MNDFGVDARPTRKSLRLKEYDYSQNGAYFITICSRSHKCLFGSVGAGLVPARAKQSLEIQLTPIGQIINKQWQNIPKQYESVELDEFIIMPNHIHGIILISHHSVTRYDTRPAPTISQMIAAFKSKCVVQYTQHAKTNSLNINTKIWQRGYYDHIIRNEQSLNSIRQYIIDNPANWHQDKYNLNT